MRSETTPLRNKLDVNLKATAAFVQATGNSIQRTTKGKTQVQEHPVLYQSIVKSA